MDLQEYRRLAAEMDQIEFGTDAFYAARRRVINELIRVGWLARVPGRPGLVRKLHDTLFPVDD